MPASATPGTQWKDGFPFVANSLVLDFVNTRPVIGGTAQELLPDFNALLRWFGAVELLTARDVGALRRRWRNSTRARRVLAELREFREDLRREVLSWEGGISLHRSTIDRVNFLLAKHPMIAVVRQTEDGARKELAFESHQPENLFAPLALAAATLFTEVDRSRVRKCRQCVLHFVDTSKKGARRWCSMQTCGNRLKVAAYARRRRRARGGDD